MNPTSRIQLLALRAIKSAGIAAVISAVATACPQATVTTSLLPGFELAVTGSSEPTLARGGSAQLTVTVTRTNGFNGPVTLAWFDQDDGNVTGPDVVVAAGQGSGQMTFSDLNNKASLGRHAIHVVGTSDGVSSVILYTGVTVAVGGTVALSVSQDQFSAVPGTTVHDTVRIARTGYTAAISLTVTPVAGIGITATAVEQPGTGISAALVLTIAGNATLSPVGSLPYAIDVKASGAGLADTHITINVIVSPNSYALTVSNPAAPITAGGSSACGLYCAKVSTNWATPFFQGRVVITGTGPAGFDITVTPQVNFDNNVHDVNVAAGASVPTGTYLITLHGITDGQLEKTATFSLQVQNIGSYQLSVQTAPLSLVAGAGSVQDVVQIIRTPGFTGSISFLTFLDDPAMTIAPSPAVTAGNQTTLAVAAAPGARAGTHVATIVGLASGIADDTANFAVNVTLPTGGVPAGIVVTPSPGTVALNGIQQFTGYLVDAQGNRTLPAPGWEISILSESSAVAQDLAPPAYDVTQRWQTRQVRGVGVGSTQVHVAYDRISDGFTTFLVLATFTVTP